MAKYSPILPHQGHIDDEAYPEPIPAEELDEDITPGDPLEIKGNDVARHVAVHDDAYGRKRHLTKGQGEGQKVNRARGLQPVSQESDCSPIGGGDGELDDFCAAEQAAS